MSDDADYPKCTVRCSKILSTDSEGRPTYCSGTCCKTATPTHEYAGTHYCSQHA